MSDTPQEGTPFKECFEEAEEVTASHILFQEWTKHYQGNKVSFYITLEKAFGRFHGYATCGSYGYKLKVIPPST